MSAVPPEARLTEAYAREWLEQAARAGGLSPAIAQPWIDAVLAQLRHGQARYGDEYLHRSLEELGREVAEEYADGPAWSIVHALRMYVDEAEGLDPGEALAARQRFLSAAGKSLAAWQDVQVGREILRQAKAHGTRRRAA